MDEPVDDERIRQIRDSMEDRKTQDLLEIWRKNDRDEWAPETFEAIRQVLLSRGFQVPRQGENNPKEVDVVDQPTRAVAHSDHKNFTRIAFYAKVMSWIVAVILGLMVIAVVATFIQMISAQQDLTSNLLLCIVLVLPVVLCGFVWIALQGISVGISILLDIKENTRRV
jgi:hypothetical protein